MNLIPMNIAVEEFDAIRGKINEITVKCKNILVVDEQSLLSASELAKDAGKVSKLIDEKKLEITRPIMARKKEIDDFAKEITAELNDSVKGLRAQILSFQQEQERKRREEAQRLAEEQARKEAELRAKMESEQEITREEVDELKDVRAKQADIASAPAPTNIRKTWEWELEDITKVPAHFLTVDAQAVKSALSTGLRDIPGIKIYQKEHLVLR